MYERGVQHLAFYTNKIKKQLKENEQITPVIETVLAEMMRIETIRNALFAEYQTDEILSKYTNKAGATNTVVNPAIKEYKAYCQQFNNLIKTLDSLLGNPREEGKPAEPDDYEKIRDRKKLKGNGT